MKKLLATLTVVTVFVAALGLLYPSTASAGLFDDLIAYWSFDDEADPTADFSGNSHDGTLGANPNTGGAGQTHDPDDPSYEAVNFAPVPGNVFSLDFDGNDDYVEAADHPALDVGSSTTTNRDFTVAAWINADSLPPVNDYSYIVSKDIGARTFNFNVTNFGELFLGVFGPGGNSFPTGTPAAIPTTDTWVHVAATYELDISDNTTRTLTLYVDGVQDGAPLVEAKGVLNNTTANLEIGRREATPFRHFDGKIDEVYIFNRALSADEIAILAAGSSVNDTCIDGLKTVGTDIKSVEVTSDGSVLTVEVFLCGAVVDRAKYRVHFDYEDPLFDVPASGDRDGNGTGGQPNDFCATTSDDTMMLERHPRGDRITGPSTTATPIMVVDGGMPVLTYTVNYSDLDGSDSVALGAGDIVAVWVDAHDKGIADRARDTDDSDGCSKPENAIEVIEHMLN